MDTPKTLEEARRRLERAGVLETDEQLKMKELLEGLQSDRNRASGDDKHRFVKVCEAIQRDRKCSLSDAMREAARDYPEAHRDFIRQGQLGKNFAEDLPEEQHEFLIMVHEYRKERGWKPTKTEAMSALLRTKKGMLLHQSYLRTFNKN